MNLRKLCIFFSALLAATLSLSAKPLESVNINDGLSDHVVNRIFKDSRGFVWFGTGLGLDRFDGNSIKSYPIPGENLNIKRVKAITEGERGEIFMGNASGLYRQTGLTDELEPMFPDRINTSVNALGYVNSTLFAATNTGLFAIDFTKNRMQRYLLNPDVMSSANNLTALHITPSGDVWGASARGLHHFLTDKGEFQHFPFNGVFSPSDIVSIGDTLFVASRGGGILPFIMSKGTRLPLINLGNNIVTAMSVREGLLIASTDGTGVFIIDPATGDALHHLHFNGKTDDLLRSNSVYSVLADDMGLLWVGYYQDGVQYTPLRRDIFTAYHPANSTDTRNMAVRAVAVEGPRKLIGTRDGLFYFDESTGRSASFTMPQLRSNMIFCIAKWGDLFYIGTYNGGMYTFNPATLTLKSFSPAPGFNNNETVFVITPDRYNYLWIGTSDGIYRLSNRPSAGDNLHFSSKNSHLPQGNVYEIFFDSTGRGWMCTEKGIAVWSGTGLSTEGFPAGFVNNQKIRDVFEDKNKRLYFVPDRGDIFTSNLDLTDFRPLTEVAPATNRAATFITDDADGMLWIGSEMGLVRYDGRETLRYFSESDGLPSKVFTLCSPIRDENSDIWMGTTRGLVQLNYDNFRQQATAMRLPDITDITSNGRSVMHRLRRGNKRMRLDLADNENNFTISHANFDYIEPGNQRVEFMLEGVDPSWRMKNGHEKIQYFNLPQGSYLFRIRQAGDPTSETSIDITVRRGVNWAIVASIILILLASVLAFLLIRLRLRARAENLLRIRQEETDRHAAEQAALDEQLKRYRTTRLSDEECRRLHRKLETLMKQEKPYTNPDLKSSDLAEMIGSSAHALSFLFNQFLHKNYYDYVNEYRVAEFKRLVSQPDSSKYTLTAMSQKCGFSSRASFFRHFKNLTGITPADFLKKQKSSN